MIKHIKHRGKALTKDNVLDYIVEVGKIFNSKKVYKYFGYMPLPKDWIDNDRE